MKFKILGGGAAASMLFAFLVYWGVAGLVSGLVFLLPGFLKKRWRGFFFSFALASAFPLMSVIAIFFISMPFRIIEGFAEIFYTYWVFIVIIACVCIYGLVVYKTTMWKIIGGFFLGLCFVTYLLPMVIILLMF